jgi:hypothetical protein
VAHWKKFGIASGKGAWKAGAFLLKWGGKGAAKGSVWTIKKVAVDPAAKKITNWGLVKAGISSKDKLQEMRDLVKNGQCANCGKKTSTSFFGGQDDLCSAACAQKLALAYNEVKQVQVPDTIDGNDNSLYLVCNCNRKSKFHGSGCTANKGGERVAENVIWSEQNPNFMKPADQPKQRKLSAAEQRRADIQQKIQDNPPKKKWHGGY